MNKIENYINEERLNQEFIFEFIKYSKLPFERDDGQLILKDLPFDGLSLWCGLYKHCEIKYIK